MWELLGFRTNILFNTPIEIEENAPNLLSGRKVELTDLVQEILSDDKIVKIVSGKTGIGKTSFLNVLQYLFYTKSDYFKHLNIYKRLLPSFYRVELSEKDDFDSVLEKIIKAISKNIKEYYANSDVKMPHPIKEIIDYWLGLKIEDSSNEQGTEWDFKILKYSNKTSLSDIYLNKTDSSFAFNSLVDLIIANTDFEGIFILFDNLEIVSSDKLIHLLNAIRDEILSRKNIYCILITSESNLLAKIHSKAKRVAGVITSLELELKSLNNFQLINAVEERIQVFKSNKNAKLYLPFSETLIYRIFEFSNLDLRETFKILQYISLREFSSQAKIDSYREGRFEISFSDGIDHLIEYAEKICQKINIDPESRGRLEKVYSNSKVQSSEYQDYDFDNKEEMEEFLFQLRKEGLIECNEMEEKQKFTYTMRLELLAVANKISNKCRDLSLDNLKFYENGS